MKPHPQFSNWKIPSSYSLGKVHLKALSVSDADKDFDAIIESAAEIKAANPTLTWPIGLTREVNMFDLAWHQKEFEARRSFAWVIEDGDSAYLGCLYVYPSISGENSADVSWWWKTGMRADKSKFREDLLAWVSSEAWPQLLYNLQSE